MGSSRRSLGVTTGLLLSVTLVSAILNGVSAVTRTQDVSTLSALMSIWPSLKSLGWNGDPCGNAWFGVLCSGDNTTVISLTLVNSGLRGTLPPEIAGLTGLQVLELSHNPGLGGQLPQELGNMYNLQTLSLQWCSFTGSVPSTLGNLQQLYFLGLNGNGLSGQIPFTFGNLSKINWVDLSSNNMVGLLPVSSAIGSNGIGLDNLTSVKHFHLNNNSFSGPLPPEIFSLPGLIHLILDHNNLQSSIPDGIGIFESLTILRLDNNQFYGNIPANLANITTLTDLHLDSNQFTGTIPDLSNMTSLQLIDLSENNLTPGEFPSWLLSMQQILTLNMARANITGQVPSGVFQLPVLESLDLSQNQLNGTLEFVGDTTTSLMYVDLTDNDIIGIAGQPEAKGQSLDNVTIILEGNALCNNPFLSPQKLGCATNNIQQNWTPTVTTCTNVKCKQRKTLNPKNCTCAFPLKINLVLTSPSFTNLTDLRVSNLETEIAQKMTAISIPLDPKQVVIAYGIFLSMDHYELDLYFFPLSGGSLSTSDQSTIVSALNQRRIAISEGPFQVPTNSVIDSPSSTGLAIGAIAGIVVGVAALSLLLLGMVLYAIRQKRRADKAVMNHPFASWGGGGSELGEAPKLKGARWFSLAELKAATGNWSDDFEIGVGGYGKVYRGVLKNGDVVAIKKAQEGSMQGAGEFKNEIELLSRVHHRNLVGLIGFCYEDGVQALIYEFMSNGTLREHLIGRGVSLTWQDRLDIALASARGLAYLHEHATPPIIHRDVKSANILLNEKMVARVADFGLSKLAPDEGEKMVYSQNIKGTLGYLDPEYYMTQQLTDKSDVYSFGIVLLELLTAKAPIENGKFVVREFRTALDKGGVVALRPLLDPLLKKLPNSDLETYLKIALTCVEEAGAERQTMGEVVKQLEALGGQTYPDAGVHDFDLDAGKKSPDVSDQADALLKTSRAKDDSSFQYSGGFGVSTTIHPK